MRVTFNWKSETEAMSVFNLVSKHAKTPLYRTRHTQGTACGPNSIYILTDNSFCNLISMYTHYNIQNQDQIMPENLALKLLFRMSPPFHTCTPASVQFLKQADTRTKTFATRRDHENELTNMFSCQQTLHAELRVDTFYLQTINLSLPPARLLL